MRTSPTKPFNVRTLARRVASTYTLRQAATTPLPESFPASEIGLMTLREFLKFRNPSGKHHPQDTFDWSLMSLNKTLIDRHTTSQNGFQYTLSEPYGGGEGYVLNQDGEPVAVLSAGVLYYSYKVKLKDLPTRFGRRGVDEFFLEYETARPVKYITEEIARVSSAARKNLRDHSYLVQNIRVKGEPYTIRAEKPPVLNEGVNLAMLNSRGEIVAIAQNEWGATLLVVAREYRGLGLGPILGKYWYEQNPNIESGGFTPSGENNAVRMWEARVHQFFTQGWYSELVRQKRLTKGRFRDIIEGLEHPVKPQALEMPKDPKPQGETLVYAHDDVLVVYNSLFLQSQEDQYIYGYGFFRDNPHVKGVFLYTLDYDRAHHKLVTLAALQMAKDMKQPLYVGQGYGDMLELEGAPVVRKGDHVVLSADVLPIKTLASRERSLRKAVDKYGEVESTLLEMAESKWS